MLALAACDAGVRQWPVRVSRNYDPHTFHAFAGGHDMPVAIHGNPFGLEQAEWGRIVTQHMQGRHAGPATNFTPTPTRPARYDLHVVLAFDGAFLQSPTDMCRGSPLPGTTTPGRLRVQAVYCVGDSDQSFFEAEIDGLQGPANPRLGQLIGRMTFALFPLRNPECDVFQEAGEFGLLLRRHGGC